MAQNNLGAPVVVTNGPTQPIPVASGGSGGTADQVQGNVAQGAASTGNPVGVGGVARQDPSNLPFITDGARTQFYTNRMGLLYVSVADFAGNSGLDGRGVLNGFSGPGGAGVLPNPVAVGGFVLNPSGTWDRQRGDTSGTWVKTPPLTGTDRSITASTTSQQLMAANTLRSKFFIKNDSAIVVWINMGATAVAAAGSGNIAIAANGGYFEFSGSSGAVNIIAASGTPAITAREF